MICEMKKIKTCWKSVCIYTIYIADGWVSLFNGISTFVGYLIPESSL